MKGEREEGREERGDGTSNILQQNFTLNEKKLSYFKLSLENCMGFGPLFFFLTLFSEARPLSEAQAVSISQVLQSKTV